MIGIGGDIMKKKYTFAWTLNLMALGSLWAVVYNECGWIVFVEVLIPSAVIFSSLFSLLHSLVEGKKDE